MNAWRSRTTQTKLFSFLFTIFAGAFALSGPFAAPVFASLSEQVTDFTLPNRLNVILLENHNAPLVIDYPERYTGLIDAVTRENIILHIAQTYLHPDAFITVLAADLKATEGKAKESEGKAKVKRR